MDGACLFSSFVVHNCFFISFFRRLEFFWGMGFGEAPEPVGSSWGSLSFSFFFSMGFDIFNGVCMVASGASPEEALLWSGGLSYVS